MKRVFSMVLAGVIAVSAMPVTAFAKDNVTATAKIVGMLEVTKAEVEANNSIIN